jgi:hypothetical protein
LAEHLAASIMKLPGMAAVEVDRITALREISPKQTRVCVDGERWHVVPLSIYDVRMKMIQEWNPGWSPNPRRAKR